MGCMMRKVGHYKMLVLCIIIGIIVLFLIAIYIVYRICFMEYRLKKVEVTTEDYMPIGKDYENHQEDIIIVEIMHQLF